MLAEKVRAIAGNFLWSGYIAVFILFVASVIFWLRERSDLLKNGWFLGRFAVCAVILTLHAVSGALFTWSYYKIAGPLKW